MTPRRLYNTVLIAILIFGFVLTLLLLVRASSDRAEAFRQRCAADGGSAVFDQSTQRLGCRMPPQERKTPTNERPYGVLYRKHKSLV